MICADAVNLAATAVFCFVAGYVLGRWWA